MGFAPAGVGPECQLLARGRRIVTRPSARLTSTGVSSAVMVVSGRMAFLPSQERAVAGTARLKYTCAGRSEAISRP
jgi:hypothetical protein